MIVRFKAYSRTNRDIKQVLKDKCLPGSNVNEPILVFGNSITHSESELYSVYEVAKEYGTVIDHRAGSFAIGCEPQKAQKLKAKFGFPEEQVKPCPGDCNLGLPCQTCGSNGQYIGEFEKQYLGNWDTNYKVIDRCGDCVDFGPNGCKTSRLEAKYGTASTPACNEFKVKGK